MRSVTRTIGASEREHVGDHEQSADHQRGRQHRRADSDVDRYGRALTAVEPFACRRAAGCHDVYNESITAPGAGSREMTMGRYLNAVTVSDAQAAAYRRDGFVKIEGLFADTVLERMRAVAEAKGGDYFKPSGLAESAMANLGSVYKFAKNLGLDRETMRDICSDPILVALREKLSPRRWGYTQSLTVELTTDKKGLNWHFGVDSFNFVGPDQDGITFWIPLDPIDPRVQGGGMAYVSESVYSGRDLVKLLYRYISEYKHDPERLKALFMFERAYRPVADPILEKNRVEDAFAPGDALIFNRHVYHRSSILREGPMQTRKAFVLRFIDDLGRFDLDFYRTMAQFAETTGWQRPSPFAEALADAGLEPGGVVIDSPVVIPV